MPDNQQATIFIVEDDLSYSVFLSHILSLNPDYELKIFHTGTELINHLNEKPDLITLDYSLPDMDGEHILNTIKSQLPDVPVIIISGQEDVKTAVSLLRKGAYDYLPKDGETKDRLWHVVRHALDGASLKAEVENLRREVANKYEFERTIIGNSPAIHKLFKLLEKAVKTNITVSITGETGTGKELVAKAIHFNSNRRSKPFVPVNIAAIPKELIESELFGHEKGAFTGAFNKRIGKFEEAHGGSIFLDEIGEMDLNLQAKLLRVIQEREVVKIGGNLVQKIEVRIIVATHRNLAQMVKDGEFREDLYYRLLGLPVMLPPLRDRDNDVLMIAKHFLDHFVHENQMDPMFLSEQAKSKLLQYRFPGNVRELKSVIELAAVLAAGSEITAEEIRFNSVLRDDNLIAEEMTLKDYTFKIITHFLEKYDHNVMLVAEKLDIGKSTIYRYIKEMEIVNSNQ
ncbi:sigma-54 dependent transcriptional regulator [Persicobacter psychrovividus]|uniref:Acetoacetate metabolism regulatory protein AtoC n=1 Tax=Persicobacter psychrovividus TaxID=387638 RepID=A0ABM7VEK0_9BACT|nr:acetoacetate metabolism regulatory protein AtoC [Persicobacter psychrovividus]